MWSRTLKCSACEVKCDRALNQMLYQWICIHVGPHTWQNRRIQQLWTFRVPWSPGFVLDLPPRDGFCKQSKWPWNTIHLMPCRNPRRLYTHLAFARSVGPSSVVWSVNLGPAPPFPPMRVLEVQWSRALSLVCEVALTVKQPPQEENGRLVIRLPPLYQHWVAIILRS